MQGGPQHKKYRIYLDPVGVAHVPESYEEEYAMLCAHRQYNSGCVISHFELPILRVPLIMWA